MSQHTSLTAGNTIRKKTQKRRRKGRLLPAPDWSDCLYVRVDPSQVHLFRYMLEAYDHLGLMSVVDRWGTILQIRFSPHQRRDIDEFIGEIQEFSRCTLVELPETLPQNELLPASADKRALA